ncbi:hypothetical protein V8C43DRAFT_173589 [Trichoderma afarasin]
MQLKAAGRFACTRRLKKKRVNLVDLSRKNNPHQTRRERERIDQRGSRQVLYRTELPQTKKSGSRQAATDATPESMRQRRASHVTPQQTGNSARSPYGYAWCKKTQSSLQSVSQSVRAAAETLVLRRPVCFVVRSKLSVELPKCRDDERIRHRNSTTPADKKKNWNGTSSIRELEPAVREERSGFEASGQQSSRSGTRRGPTASAAPPTAMEQSCGGFGEAKRRFTASDLLLRGLEVVCSGQNAKCTCRLKSGAIPSLNHPISLPIRWCMRREKGMPHLQAASGSGWRLPTAPYSKQWSKQLNSLGRDWSLSVWGPGARYKCTY